MTWLEDKVKFAKERMHLADIPSEEIELSDLISPLFYGMRHELDCFAFKEYQTSRWVDVRDLFIRMHRLSPNAISFLELGTGTGYPLRVALRLGYDAIGTERSEEMFKAARISLAHFGYDPERVILGDFLQDNSFKGKGIPDFDLIHLWTIEEVVFQALLKIIPQMKKNAVLFTGFEQPFSPEEIRDYLKEKGISADVQGWGSMAIRRN